jgi:hypothetical protein
VEGHAKPFPGEVREQGSTQLAVASHVGTEEASEGAGTDCGEHAPFEEGSRQAHQLLHATPWTDALDHADAVEIDHDALGLRLALAQQEILDLEIGVATPCIVQTSDGTPRRLGGAQDP